MAVALPVCVHDGDDEMFNENNKVFDVLKGGAEFEVQNVNAAEGEFGGVFVSCAVR